MNELCALLKSVRFSHLDSMVRVFDVDGGPYIAIYINLGKLAYVAYPFKFVRAEIRMLDQDNLGI